MTSPGIQDAVLRLFEAARQSPGAAYEPERFMAYLTSPPPPSGRRVADTFAGRRRLIRFMDSVQLEWAVCFTNDDWERGVGLDQFVTMIEKKLANPKQAERLAGKRLQEARNSLVGEPVKFGIFTAGLLAVPAAYGGLLVRSLLLLLWIAITLGVAIVNVRQYQFAQKLVARTAAVRSRQAMPERGTLVV